MSHITLWVSCCQRTHKQGEEGGEEDRFAAALTQTLTAARTSCPYITAETDWTEKPFGFIIALQTAAAGS